MLNRLDAQVLTVDANVIHQVDTTNSANLYSMWTVFSRCADSVEQGQRLENLSWRIWQKEQLVESSKAITAPAATYNTRTSPQTIPFDTRLPEVPQLSGSVESVADADETIEFTSVSAPLEIVRPHILRQESSLSTRGSRRERQTSPEFEKMIVSIVHNKAPFSAPHPTAMMHSHKRAMVPIIEPAFHRSGSTSTESQSPSKDSDSHSEESHPSPDLPSKTTTVVRGFSTSQASKPKVVLPTVFPTKTTPLPELTASPAPKVVQAKKQPNFTLGASYSSSEQGRSLETRKPLPSAMAKKDAQFTLGGSSEEEGSMKKSLIPAHVSGLTKQHKQTSFSNHVTMHYADEPDNAIESDSDDYIDESAIDDEDDSSDWEDSIEDSGKSSVDDKYFQRVDSKVNLTSRRSLITLMIAQSDDRVRNLGGHASQSTSAIPQNRNARHGPSLGGSPNDSDEAPLMMKGARQTLKPIKEVPRSNAQPITMPVHSHGQAALSPRTTRRNMLSTELTESLRRHLLWERSQKSSTANAVLKRRHTSHDVANLKQYPDKSCIKQSEDVNSSSWNQYFAKDTFDGYHSKGW